MPAKHLIKNLFLKKTLFFVACVGILTLALLSVCTSQKADAQQTLNFDDTNAEPSFIIKGPGGDVFVYDDLRPSVSRTWEDNKEILSYLDQSSESKSHIVDSETVFSISQTHWSSDNTEMLYIGFSWETPVSGSCTFNFFVQSSELFPWMYSLNGSEYIKVPDYTELSCSDVTQIVFKPSWFTEGANVSGVVTDAENPWKPVPGAFVQYYHRTLWGDIPVPEMNTFTDWFGHYTLEGIEDDMLPGVIKVFRYGYDVGESWSIWGAPEGEDTVYRFIQMTPEQPQPPVPPTPPDPPVPPGPVPPGPVPPEPVPPVPPTPVPPAPTPVDPGGNIAQTGDAMPLAPIVALFVVAALGFGLALRKEF